MVPLHVGEQSESGKMAGSEAPRPDVWVPSCRAKMTATPRRKPEKPFAWVALVMGLDLAYVGAALVLGSSLKRRSQRAERVVMVTPDVPLDCRKVLGEVFDSVVEVPYLETLALQKYSERFDSMYNYWLDKCFTKFGMFSLTEYEKVIFLDSDMLAVEEPDDLFDCPAPAGICSSVRDMEENAKLHANKIPRSMVEESLKNGQGRYGVRGCLLIVKPNAETYVKIRTKVEARECYGSLESMVGPDEYMITRFYAGQWSHIHAKYGWVSWADREELGVAPVFLHYVSQKPWDEGEEWDDFEYWKKEAGNVVREVPESLCFFGRMMADISKLAEVEFTPEVEAKAVGLKALSKERKLAEKMRREANALKLGIDLTSTATPRMTPRNSGPSGMWRPPNSARPSLPNQTTPRMASTPPLSAREPAKDRKGELIVKANSNILVVHGFKRPYPSKPRTEGKSAKNKDEKKGGKEDGKEDGGGGSESEDSGKGSPSEDAAANQNAGKPKIGLGLGLGLGLGGNGSNGVQVPRLNLASLGSEGGGAAGASARKGGGGDGHDGSTNTWTANHWSKRHGGNLDSHRSMADMDDDWRATSALLSPIVGGGEARESSAKGPGGVQSNRTPPATPPHSARAWNAQNSARNNAGQGGGGGGGGGNNNSGGQPSARGKGGKYQRWENPPKSSRADLASSWRATPRDNVPDSGSGNGGGGGGGSNWRSTPRGEGGGAPRVASGPPSAGGEGPGGRDQQFRRERSKSHVVEGFRPTPRNHIPQLNGLSKLSPRDFRNDPPANGPYSARYGNGSGRPPNRYGGGGGGNRNIDQQPQTSSGVEGNFATRYLANSARQHEGRNRSPVGKEGGFGGGGGRPGSRGAVSPFENNRENGNGNGNGNVSRGRRFSAGFHSGGPKEWNRREAVRSARPRS